MKRKSVIILSILTIGVITGFAISHLLSNTVNFNVVVDSSEVLNVSVQSKTTTTLYKEVWYNDTTIIKVNNKDTIQGYKFLFYMQVNTSAHLAASDMTVVMKKSTDGTIFHSAETITLSTYALNGLWALEGNYRNGATTNIGAKGSSTESVWFQVDFKFNAGSPSTSPWTFRFFANGDNL